MSVTTNTGRFKDLQAVYDHFARLNYRTVNIYKAIVPQTSTAAAVELHELGGTTVAYLSAVSDLYCWCENNHANGLALAVVVEYLDGSYEVQTATGAMDAADSSSAEKITGVATDFLYLRTLNIVTTANTGYAVVGKSDKTAIWGVVEQANSYSLHSRYYAPLGYSSVLKDVYITLPDATATNLYTVTITYTPKKTEIAVTETYHFNGVTEWRSPEILTELEIGSSVVTTIKKDADANHVVVQCHVNILEATT